MNVTSLKNPVCLTLLALSCGILVGSFEAYAEVSTGAPPSGVPLLTSNTRLSTNISSQATPSSWSTLFAEKYFFGTDPNASLLRTEATLSYDINAMWAVSLSGAYGQPTGNGPTELADFDDTELALAYKFMPVSYRKSLDGSISVVGILPTAHYSTLVTEQGGAAADLLMVGTVAPWLKTRVRSRFAKFFYQDNFAARADTPPPSTLHGSITDSSLFTTPSGLPADNGLANISNYQEHAINFIFSIGSALKVRHQNFLQVFNKFDGKTTYSFHEQPGLGYAFSENFILWYVMDANKMLGTSGTVYDSKNIVHVTSAYFSF